MKTWLLRNYNLEKMAVLTGILLGLFFVAYDKMLMTPNIARGSNAGTNSNICPQNGLDKCAKPVAYFAPDCGKIGNLDQCFSLYKNANQEKEKELAQQPIKEEELAPQVAGVTTQKPSVEIAPVPKPIPPKPIPPKPKVSSGIPGVRFTNDPGQMSCHLKGKNHPTKSANKGNHVDEDCCIDKDEWLEPGCTYLYSDRGVSLNGKK